MRAPVVVLLLASAHAYQQPGSKIRRRSSMPAPRELAPERLETLKRMGMTYDELGVLSVLRMQRPSLT